MNTLALEIPASSTNNKQCPCLTEKWIEIRNYLEETDKNELKLLMEQMFRARP